jgi:anti-anti-sigma regulatory factor
MAYQSLTWKIRKHDDRTFVIFEGVLDEDSALQELYSLTGKATFDLAGIKRCNSSGIRLWVELMRGLTSVTELEFIRCSEPIVNQLSMIMGFQGKAKVRSVFAPYFCPKTGDIEQRLLEIDHLEDPMHPPTFATEGGVLEFDEMPERYFAFLIEKR